MTEWIQRRSGLVLDTKALTIYAKITVKDI